MDVTFRLGHTVYPILKLFWYHYVLGNGSLDSGSLEST